jgi:hypothetical protein
VFDDLAVRRNFSAAPSSSRSCHWQSWRCHPNLTCSKCRYRRRTRPTGGRSAMTAGMESNDSTMFSQAATTTALIQPAFYPELPFTSKRPPEQVLDAGGRGVAEVAHRMVQVSGGPADAGLAHAAADGSGRCSGQRCVRPLVAERLRGATSPLSVPTFSRQSASALCGPTRRTCWWGRPTRCRG